ncbi:oxidoreductase-like domain-containing protein [Paludibacterium paludis]|uniref:Oxidoreductase-like domain-containing protein n=1 Tax=Paludibacterium paludis TaxID=1225769 RepID=A0A918NWU4_9NEIS|nr:oxidoreductase-like domain-containing protein [Paludibacterium paludis]GGY02790.1 hypothetical protein GCM10011289_01160 [Paludibacterium paludis]
MRDGEAFDPEPEAPVAPEDSMCCGSGCDPCVWDLYREEMDDYRRRLDDWRARREKE